MYRLLLAVFFAAMLVACGGDDNDRPKLQVMGPLRCESQSVPGIEGCSGRVRNISDQKINDLRAGVHWITDDGKPAGDSLMGDVEFSPILPGQEATFFVTTPRKNPAFTKYKVFFHQRSSPDEIATLQWSSGS